jgi:hypothetical protein
MPICFRMQHDSLKVRHASMDNVPPCYTAGLSSIPARHSTLRSAGGTKSRTSSEESYYVLKKIIRLVLVSFKKTRKVATSASASDALATRLHLIHNQLHLFHTRPNLIHTRLHLIHSRLHIIQTQLHLTHTQLHLIHTRLDFIHSRLHLIRTLLHLIH